jgi:hypothetical protein
VFNKVARHREHIDPKAEPEQQQKFRRQQRHYEISYSGAIRSLIEGNLAISIQS